LKAGVYILFTYAFNGLMTVSPSRGDVNWCRYLVTTVQSYDFFLHF